MTPKSSSEKRTHLLLQLPQSTYTPVRAEARAQSTAVFSSSGHPRSPWGRGTWTQVPPPHSEVEQLGCVLPATEKMAQAAGPGGAKDLRREGPWHEPRRSEVTEARCRGDVQGDARKVGMGGPPRNPRDGQSLQCPVGGAEPPKGFRRGLPVVDLVPSLIYSTAVSAADLRGGVARVQCRRWW